MSDALCVSIVVACAAAAAHFDSGLGFAFFVPFQGRSCSVGLRAAEAHWYSSLTTHCADAGEALNFFLLPGNYLQLCRQHGKVALRV